MVIAHSSLSHTKIKAYFYRFPLYYSKYLAYKDWAYVGDLRVSGVFWLVNKLQKFFFIKLKFNKKVYNFSHIESLTL
jgi:hypothetical protein